MNEVYDVFFRPAVDWPNASLRCISPHNLIDGDSLKVSPSLAPGAGAPEDIVYGPSPAYGAEYSPASGTFSIRMMGSKGKFSPVCRNHSGKVLPVVATIPDEIRDDEVARDVLAKTGTVFDLALGDLSAGQHYAFRIIIEPSRLLGLEPPRSISTGQPDTLKTQWAQDATITCHKNCRFDFDQLVRDASHETDCAAACATILSLVEATDLKIARILRHRLVLVAPAEWEIDHAEVGLAWFVIKRQVGDSRLALEWQGGVSIYWLDDAELLARRAWHYLGEVARHPESKESMASGLNVAFDACSTVVDALATQGVIRLADVGQQLYDVVSVSEEELNRKCAEIGADGEVVSRFGWVGYRISYTIRYGYLRPDDRREYEQRKALMEHRRRQDRRLALAGLILAIASIGVSVAIGLLALLL